MAPHQKFSRGGFEHPEFMVPLVRARRWRRESSGERERLVIIVDGNGIDLLEELSAGFEPPFGVLYELLLSRSSTHLEGRYQSPEPLERWQMLHFLRKYETFLGGDGRHNLWIVEVQGRGQLVYDQHELLFAYGDLERYEGLLQSLGYAEGELDLPDPHAHAYHEEFDGEEERLLAEFEWILFPAPEDAG